MHKTIIPTGWKQVKLGDIGKVSMCKRIFKHETLPIGSVPFYKISTFGKIADSFISKEIFEEYKRKYPYPKKGEILISASGTIGRTVVFNGEESYFQDSNIVWISNSQNKVLNDFLKYVYLKTKWKSTDGGIISRLYNEDIRSIKFLLPPIPEQQKIVEVLETWDEYLEKLKKDIKAKRKIKKGLMQRLLTGKKRLPGFSGKWEKIKLGACCELITKGTTPTSIGHSFTPNGVNFIKIESITQEGHILNDKVAYISNETHNKLNRSKLNEGDILFSIAGALGRVGLVKEYHLPANTNQALAIIRIGQASKLDLYYLELQLRSGAIKKYIDRINVQAAQANLSLKNINDFIIPIPIREEQTAIANILTTADQEIEALEKKRELIEAQKKFLLNNLVTGKIRLPEFINAT